MVNYLGESNIKASQVGSSIRPGTVWANFDTQDIVGFTIEVMKTLPGTDGKTPMIVGGKVLV